jgi:hypothetical protein
MNLRVRKKIWSREMKACLVGISREVHVERTRGRQFRQISHILFSFYEPSRSAEEDLVEGNESMFSWNQWPLPPILSNESILKSAATSGEVHVERTRCRQFRQISHILFSFYEPSRSEDLVEGNESMFGWNQ